MLSLVPKKMSHIKILTQLKIFTGRLECGLVRRRARRAQVPNLKGTRLIFNDLVKRFRVEDEKLTSQLIQRRAARSQRYHYRLDRNLSGDFRCYCKGPGAR